MISLDFLQAIPNIPAKPAGIKNALFISKIFVAPSDGATNLKRLGVPWPEAAISLQQVNAVEANIPHDMVWSLFEQSAGQIERAAGELAVTQSEPVDMLVYIQPSYLVEG